MLIIEALRVLLKVFYGNPHIEVLFLVTCARNTLQHVPDRGPNTARGAPHPAAVRSNVNSIGCTSAGRGEFWGYDVTGVAIVPDGVHPGIQQVKIWSGGILEFPHGGVG